MTATTPTATGRRWPYHGHATVRDALAIAGRNLIALRRVPSLLVFSTIQPVVFLLLFRYASSAAWCRPRCSTCPTSTT